jgi:hypothetical protein
MSNEIKSPSFFEGGKAIFTVSNPSGEHELYRIRFYTQDGKYTYNKGEAKRWQRSGTCIGRIIELYLKGHAQPVIFNQYVTRVKEQRKGLI